RSQPIAGVVESGTAEVRNGEAGLQQMSTPQVRHVLHELNVIFGGALIRLRAAARERVEDDDAGAGLDADGAPDLPPEQEAELAQHLRPGDPSMPDDQF